MQDGEIVGEANKRSVLPLEYHTILYIWSDWYSVFNDPILTYDNDIMRPDIHISTPGPYHVAQHALT